MKIDVLKYLILLLFLETFEKAKKKVNIMALWTYHSSHSSEPFQIFDRQPEGNWNINTIYRIYRVVHYKIKIKIFQIEDSENMLKHKNSLENFVQYNLMSRYVQKT